MYGHGGGMGMGWMWLIWLLVIIASVAVVAVVALLVRSGSDRARTPRSADEAAGGTSAARRILDERYARGEIDEQDYLERRRHLDAPDS